MDESDDALDRANRELVGVSPIAAEMTTPKREERDPPNWIRPTFPAPSGLAEQTLAPETLARLRLGTITGIGPRTMTALLERFETAVAVLKADSSELAMVPGLGAKTIEQIRLETRSDSIDEIVQWCRTHNTQLLVREQAGYPAAMNDLEDAPALLYCRGEIVASDEMAVAIVGTRHATRYGLRQAERIAHSLARAGVTVISGLARGIDAAAHEGALAGGGRTIAVLGGGLAQMYPPEHEGLAAAIAADGAVISEHPPMIKPRSGHFPQRNRLVASLGLATLVIEAPDRSGSMITARLAGEQNRQVLALPGPVDSRTSRGCHQLIRDGAILVTGVDDILEALGPTARPVPGESGTEIRNPAELKLNDIERQVLAAIDPTSTPIDAVIEATGLPAHRVIATISVLEMRRLIRRLSGQYVSRI